MIWGAELDARGFRSLLRESLVPLLREDGFRGSDPRYRRHEGDCLQVPWIQASRSGGRCFLNLGIHFDFLPVLEAATADPDTYDPKKMKEPECDFRVRIGDDYRYSRTGVLLGDDEVAPWIPAYLRELLEERPG